MTSPQRRLVMDNNQIQIEEVNHLLHAVEERIESLMLDLQQLDALKDAAAYQALDKQIRVLNEQQRILTKRWGELTAGYSDNT